MINVLYTPLSKADYINDFTRSTNWPDTNNRNIAHFLCMVQYDLELRKISSKWIPKSLNANQKRGQVTMSKKMYRRFEDFSSFSDRIVTQDETWIHHCESETKE